MSLENDLNNRKTKSTGNQPFESPKSANNDTRQRPSPSDSSFGSNTQFNQVETSYEEDKTSKFLRRLLFGGFVVMFVVYLGMKDSQTDQIVFINEVPAIMAPPVPPVFTEEAQNELAEKITEELEASGVVNSEEISAAVEQQVRQAEAAFAEAATESSFLREFTEGISDGFNTARYNEDLLAGMGTWMEEMGYTGLSREDLINLRDKGVTATYTNGIRELGYTEITLDEIIRLQDSDVSVRFAAMMQTLNYDLSVEDMVRLRRASVTASYTSNLHDLGYRDISLDELIRFKQVGVTTSDIKRLMRNDSGERPNIEEVLRYKISNQ